MKSKVPQIIILLIFLFLVFFLVNKFFYQNIKDTAFSFFSPIEKFFWQRGNDLSQWLEGVFEINKIKVDNEELKKENLFLKNKILNLTDAERENKELRQALDLGLNQEYDLIFADIISKKTEEDSLLINQGKKNGIKEGMAVVTGEKVLVGKIGKVFDNFSQVDLISQKGFNFDAKIAKAAGAGAAGAGAAGAGAAGAGAAGAGAAGAGAAGAGAAGAGAAGAGAAGAGAAGAGAAGAGAAGEDEALGVIRGQGNFKIKIELLPKEIEIKEGDTVATSILGGVFPENLLIGTIKTIKKNDLIPFQEAEIDSYFKEIMPDHLFVIKRASE